MRPFSKSVGLVVVMVASMGIPGCGVGEGLLAMRDQAEQVRGRIESDRAALAASAAALPEGDPARAKIEAMLDEREAQSRAYDRAIEGLDALLAQQGDPAGAIESGVGLLVPFLPPGTRTPVLLAGGLAAALWRAGRLKRAGLSIAEGLDKAMRADEDLREGVRRNAGVLRTVQTRTAHRLVDEATKDRPMMRLPL